jgi:hypothetical protein
MGKINEQQAATKGKTGNHIGNQVATVGIQRYGTNRLAFFIM